MVKENQWDWDKARVYRLDTKPAPLLIRPSTTCGSPDYDPWVIPEVEPVEFADNNPQQETTTCPSLVSCFAFFRRLFSFVWQCVWRWPWPKEQLLLTPTTHHFMQSATLSEIMLCQLIIFSLLTQGLLLMISLDSQSDHDHGRNHYFDYCASSSSLSSSSYNYIPTNISTTTSTSSPPPPTTTSLSAFPSPATATPTTASSTSGIRIHN